jgi:hypothetical protein
VQGEDNMRESDRMVGKESGCAGKGQDVGVRVGCV